MPKSLIILFSIILLTTFSCQQTKSTMKSGTDNSFQVNAESFADLQVLRYQVPGWEKLTPQQQELAYYLYEASLSGRDIIWDQRGKYNLMVRKTIEAIWKTPGTAKNTSDWEKFRTYSGQVFFSNGIYHHYSSDKLTPEFTYDYFATLVRKTNPADLPLFNGANEEQLLSILKQVIFTPGFQPKMVDLRAGVDNVANSANNFYEGVTQQEVETFYDKFPKSDQEPEWGLNSKVVKENGKLVEHVWKSGGMYGSSIDKMIYWLEKGISV